MSFELSPETIIFSLRSQITNLQDQIIDLENSIVEIPEQIFRTVETKNIQGFFSGGTRQVLIRNISREALIQDNTNIQIRINSLKSRISTINSQISLLEKESEIRQIEGLDGQELIIQKPNNDLRNALLIGGAILIL